MQNQVTTRTADRSTLVLRRVAKLIGPSWATVDRLAMLNAQDKVRNLLPLVGSNPTDEQLVAAMVNEPNMVAIVFDKLDGSNPIAKRDAVRTIANYREAFGVVATYTLEGADAVRAATRWIA